MTEYEEENRRLDLLYDEYCRLEWDSRLTGAGRTLTFCEFRGVELLIFQKRDRNGAQVFGIGIDKYDYTGKYLEPFTAPSNGKGFIWKCENRNIYDKRDAKKALFLLMETLGLTDGMNPEEPGTEQ